jgi:hypothetical protein
MEQNKLSTSDIFVLHRICFLVFFQKKTCIPFEKHGFLLLVQLDGKMAEKRHQFDRDEVLKLTPHAAERATIKKSYPVCRWIKSCCTVYVLFSENGGGLAFTAYWH